MNPDRGGGQIPGKGSALSALSLSQRVRSARALEGGSGSRDGDASGLGPLL